MGKNMKKEEGKSQSKSMRMSMSPSRGNPKKVK